MLVSPQARGLREGRTEVCSITGTSLYCFASNFGQDHILICRGEWNLACNFDADALVQVSFLSRDEVKKKMFT